MTQEIEIEFKNIVSKLDFDKLLSNFSIDRNEFRKQENFYFDSSDFQLKAKESALRIRIKQGKYILTLKEPCHIGLLETHQEISKEEAECAFQGGSLPNGEVAKQLQQSLEINIESCLLLGALTTYRAEKPYFQGTLVFDHSLYLGNEDFEIEYEVTEAASGKKIFKQLFDQLQIPIVQTDNKIRRFFQLKALQTGGENNESNI